MFFGDDELKVKRRCTVFTGFGSQLCAWVAEFFLEKGRVLPKDLTVELELLDWRKVYGDVTVLEAWEDVLGLFIHGEGGWKGRAEERRQVDRM